MDNIGNFWTFLSCAGHSPSLGSDIRLKPSMGQDIANESKFVKIDRLEPEIWVDKPIALMLKIYIS
jgi:hypothetical protein